MEPPDGETVPPEPCIVPSACHIQHKIRHIPRNVPDEDHMHRVKDIQLTSESKDVSFDRSMFFFCVSISLNISAVDC